MKPRRWFVLAVLAGRAVWAQAPAYTAAGIVNASDYSPGPFAPNSVLSVFGTNLSWASAAWTGGGGDVSLQVAGTAVYVDEMPVFVLYVSPSQVNFIVPSNTTGSAATVRVVREGATGPDVTVNLVDAAPALFNISGFAIATHADGTLLTAASPAQPGEIIVIYATGLGETVPNPGPYEVPGATAPIEWLSSLVVSLNGMALPSSLIQYAGLTPGCVGLYQINLQLPPDALSNPTIQVAVAGRSSAGPLEIAVQ